MRYADIALHPDAAHSRARADQPLLSDQQLTRAVKRLTIRTQTEPIVSAVTEAAKHKALETLKSIGGGLTPVGPKLVAVRNNPTSTARAGRERMSAWQKVIGSRCNGVFTDECRRKTKDYFTTHPDAFSDFLSWCARSNNLDQSESGHFLPTHPSQVGAFLHSGRGVMKLLEWREDYVGRRSAEFLQALAPNSETFTGTTATTNSAPALKPPPYTILTDLCGQDAELFGHLLFSALQPPENGVRDKSAVTNLLVAFAHDFINHHNLFATRNDKSAPGTSNILFAAFLESNPAECLTLLKNTLLPAQEELFVTLLTTMLPTDSAQFFPYENVLAQFLADSDGMFSADLAVNIMQRFAIRKPVLAGGLAATTLMAMGAGAEKSDDFCRGIQNLASQSDFVHGFGSKKGAFNVLADALVGSGSFVTRADIDTYTAFAASMLRHLHLQSPKVAHTAVMGFPSGFLSMLLPMAGHTLVDKFFAYFKSIFD